MATASLALPCLEHIFDVMAGEARNYSEPLSAIVRSRPGRLSFRERLGTSQPDRKAAVPPRDHAPRCHCDPSPEACFYGAVLSRRTHRFMRNNSLGIFQFFAKAVHMKWDIKSLDTRNSPTYVLFIS